MSGQPDWQSMKQVLDSMRVCLAQWSDKLKASHSLDDADVAAYWKDLFTRTADVDAMLGAIDERQADVDRDSAGVLESLQMVVERWLIAMRAFSRNVPIDPALFCAVESLDKTLRRPDSETALSMRERLRAAIRQIGEAVKRLEGPFAEEQGRLKVELDQAHADQRASDERLERSLAEAAELRRAFEGQLAAAQGMASARERQALEMIAPLEARTIEDARHLAEEQERTRGAIEAAAREQARAAALEHELEALKSRREADLAAREHQAEQQTAQLAEQLGLARAEGAKLVSEAQARFDRRLEQEQAALARRLDEERAQIEVKSGNERASLKQRVAELETELEGWRTQSSALRAALANAALHGGGPKPAPELASQKPQLAAELATLRLALDKARKDVQAADLRASAAERDRADQAAEKAALAKKLSVATIKLERLSRELEAGYAKRPKAPKA